MTEPPGETGGAAPGDDPEDDVAPTPPERNWAGLSATVHQAMEWGIDLSGQLAAIHADDVVVGAISPATIARSRFDQPTLPEPDPRATNAVWEDIAALADAVRGLVADPSPEFVNALLPPYATAVALGQELQDAQRAMGLPVAPIPFEPAPLADLGGFPLEVPPEPEEPTAATPGRDESLADTVHDADDAHDRVQADLDRRPDPRALLIVAVLVLAVAVAVGIGWR